VPFIDIAQCDDSAERARLIDIARALSANADASEMDLAAGAIRGPRCRECGRREKIAGAADGRGS
jgi:hypothetical protein